MNRRIIQTGLLFAVVSLSLISFNLFAQGFEGQLQELSQQPSFIDKEIELIKKDPASTAIQLAQFGDLSIDALLKQSEELKKRTEEARSKLDAEKHANNKGRRKRKKSDAGIWNLKKVDIRSLINRVGKETGKTFVIDPRVQGAVTLITDKGLSPDELYQVFLAVLQVHGFAAIEMDNIVKIVREQDANTTAGNIREDIPHHRLDESTIRIVHIRNVPVKELVNTVRPLISKSSYIAPYIPSNDIIIADRAANIDRIVHIINKVDHPSSNDSEVVTLKFANPDDIVDIITSIENSQPSNKDNPIILASDERTNSIIIYGAPSRREQIRNLVTKMDRPSKDNGNIRVIYLKYTRASDIAPIVGNIIEEYNSRQGIETAPGSGSSAQPSSTRSSTSSISNIPSTLSSSSSSSSSSGLTNFHEQFASLNQDNKGPKSGSVSGAVQWEETTNSIIIKATPELFRIVRGVIAKLDIRRPQVLVETIIAEIGVDRARDFGVEWNTNGEDLKLGTRFPNPGLSSIEGPLGGSGSASDVINSFIPGAGLTLGYFHNGDLRKLLRAIGSDTSANILSTPNIVTLDNETAIIKVGELVPFITGEERSDVSGGGTPFTRIEREEVGLSLMIRPQITQSGAIKLEINHVLSNIVEGADISITGNPTTAERVITTNVMVDNGETLVLGGLIRNDWTKITTKIPVLGDLPMFGHLFRSDSKQLRKRNLMIFLKPVIMRDKLGGIAVTNKKYHFIRQEQLEIGRDKPYQNEPPVIPQLQGPVDLPPPFHHHF